MTIIPDTSVSDTRGNMNTVALNNCQPSVNDIAISSKEYQAIRQFIYKAAGIELGEAKQALVTARLRKRLRHYGLSSYADYVALANDPKHLVERQTMMDLLTTNETYFFREKSHFEFMRQRVLPHHPPRQPFRFWSAASSSGEEAYSVAMELAEFFDNNSWSVVGSDISSRVLQQASSGHYEQRRIDGIPDAYLKKYCLKGKGVYANTLLIDEAIKQYVSFVNLNLVESQPQLGQFDVIFLRNMLIYFDQSKRQQIIDNIYPRLNPGAYLFIGHSESIKGMHPNLHYVAPTIYQKII
ncbi:MAG: chemotaxis protein methyltransferase CheR [Cellvibrionaceae bacterium]|jgi:chemotaxis protein methyltransferase CheR